MKLEAQPGNQSAPSAQAAESTESQESILVRAVVMYEGEAFEGRSHFEAVEKLTETHPDWVDSEADARKGFKTSKGRFIGRVEAAEIAFAAGQLDHHDPEEKERIRQEGLHSQHLLDFKTDTVH